jgi:signal transduction histidine kinase
VNVGSNVHFTAYLRDISERKAFIDQLANDERAARAVSETAVWLLDEESTEDTLGRVLAHVGRAIDADRGHIYVMHEIDGERDAGVKLLHAWSAADPHMKLGAESQAPRLWDPVFRRWFELLRASNPIVGWTKDLPVAERMGIEAIGVVSFAIVPIFVDQEYWGSLGFDDTRAGRTWSETEITILRTLASTIGAAVKRQRLSAALLHRERLATLGTITSSVAHELNSPLGAILNSAERLTADASAPIDETARRNLMLIEKAALRSKLVIERLLATSHESARPAASSYPRQVVEDCIDLYGKHIELQGITINLSTESDRRAAMGSTELSQLITNLLFNARDAVVDADGDLRRIDVSVRDVDSMIEISVDDSGPGISEQARSRAFDAFFTTKDSGSGTGLGLWICRRLVVEAGGSISLVNTGHGTRAVAILPAMENA